MVVRIAQIALVGLIVTLFRAGPALASNDSTTIVLHAMETLYDCSQPPPFDCGPESRPAVAVQAGSPFFVYVFLRNYEEVAMVTARFAVDGGSGATTWGDWELLAADFSSCLFRPS
jgi:hypothetical protein